VRQLSNDVEADRDYNTGVKNVESQSAHAVSAKASVLLGGNEGEIWDCKTSDGYMCNCKRRNGAQDVRRARQIPSWVRNTETAPSQETASTTLLCRDAGDGRREATKAKG